MILQPVANNRAFQLTLVIATGCTTLPFDQLVRFFNRLRKTTARPDGGGFATVCVNQLSSIESIIAGSANLLYSSNAALQLIEIPWRTINMRSLRKFNEMYGCILIDTSKMGK